MSLRRRLFVLLLVAFGALAILVVGAVRLLGDGASAREAAPTAAGLQAARTLALHLDAAPDGALAPVLADLSGGLDDGVVGVCYADGHIGEHRGHIGGPMHGHDHGPPPGRGPPPDPPPGDGPPGHGDLRPFDEDAITRACRSAAAEPRSMRTAAPMDVLFVAAMRTRRGPIAFAITRAELAPEQVPVAPLALLGFMGVTTALLLGLAAHGAWVLRQSTTSLEASVDALQRDLRAPIAEPRATELAAVASHLRLLAATLADAQERERTLVSAVEEEKRLAGLGRVVAGVAHEVRNPLAGMKLRLESMALRSLDGRSRTDVERCLREIGRLDRLVRTLLLASRKRAVERTRFALGALVAERVALLAVPVEVEGDATVDAEREGLAGLVDNLLRNAIEASPPEGVVRVVVTADDPVRLEVVDEGAGIPPERAGELFEPFFTTKGSGTGLGLVLARAVAEAHGGTIEYERRDARTVFCVKIPTPEST